jgi:acyl-CoA reductase-like NAD-dependent aldehyde dehydrogenase
MNPTPAIEVDDRRQFGDYTMLLDSMRHAQKAWAATHIRERLRMLRAVRHAIAAEAGAVAASVPRNIPGALHRTNADTLMVEVLPLLEAIRFLEREAEWILRPQQMSTLSRPFWLGGVTTEIQRAPLGIVLIIGPANYPLFLPAAQALQALAAGNAVLWKPAPGGEEAARVIRGLLVAAGLDTSLVTVLDSSTAAATDAIRAGVDKVFLTGSATTGRAVMSELAETLTPSVMELSGCDAVFILDGADLNRVVDALTFGMRLNGSATCMAPRRVFATPSMAKQLSGLLATALDGIQPIPVPQKTHDLLEALVSEATALGANALLNGLGYGSAECPAVCATLLMSAAPHMRITQTDIFAPVLSLIEVANEDEAVTAYTHCPYALSASVFGPRKKAEALAGRLLAGNVLVNDIIVATADPRAPFGGRGKSGFGVTRGREGLLEMTALKILQFQTSSSRRAYQTTTAKHAELFVGYIEGIHGKGWRQRWLGMVKLFRAARKMK